MRFRRFQNRLLFFLLCLLTLSQAAAFLAVNASLTANARRSIAAQLEVAARVFFRTVSERTSYLTTSARVLSGDYAFKTAFATGDHSTIISALENYKLRMQADAMFLVSLRRTLTASTLQPRAKDAPLPFPGLLAAAGDEGEASALVFMDGRAYQALLVPLLDPEPVAWLGAGFLIDDKLASEVQKTTLADISFLRAGQGGAWTCLASTLPSALENPLLGALGRAA